MSTAPEASELATNYLRLAHKIANRWTARTPHLREEFESAALMELWRCATSFDPARGVKFATRFHRRCRFALINVLRREWLASFPSQFVPKPGMDRHPTDLAAGREPPPDTRAELADEVALLGRLLDSLPEDRRAMFVRHHGNGETLDEIVADVGTSRANVGAKILSDLRRLQEAAQA